VQSAGSKGAFRKQKAKRTKKAAHHLHQETQLRRKKKKSDHEQKTAGRIDKKRSNLSRGKDLKKKIQFRLCLGVNLRKQRMNLKRKPTLPKG